MATPVFYVYYEDDGPLTKLDLGQALNRLDESPGIEASVSVTSNGHPTTHVHRITFDVTILLERFGTVGSDDVERKMHALQNHLDRGGYVGFSRNSAKTWAALQRAPIGQGDTALSTHGNAFTSWSLLGALASGDEVVIEQAEPGWRREVRAVSSQSGGSVTLSGAAEYNYDDPLSIVRWRDFYPVLWRPAAERGRPILTNDRRRNYTLDLTLTYSVSMAVGLWSDATWTTGYEVGRGDFKGPLVAGPLPFDGPSISRGTGGRSLGAVLGGRVNESVLTGRRIP